MTQPHYPTPKAILLASDLSARSDRATERAVQLAQQWQSRLVVLTVLPKENSFSRPNHFVAEDADTDAQHDSPALLLKQRALRDLGPAADGLDITVRVESGEVGALALQVAEQEQCGLIVTGLARSDALGRAQIGSSVLWLLRHARNIPLLVVHAKVHGAYQHIVVATDYSEPATRALHTANQWWRQRTHFCLLHGYDVPNSVMAVADEKRHALLNEAAAKALDEAQHYVQQQLPQECPAEIKTALANPVRLLRHEVDHAGAELVVIASHGRNKLMDKLVGSVATRLLETAKTDTLIVH